MSASNVVNPVDESQTPEPVSPWADPAGPPQRGVSGGAVALAIFALLIGVVFGYVRWRDPPSAALVREQQAVQDQQEQIAQLNSHIEALESELDQRSPGAAEVVERDQDLDRREEAVARRERELAGRWTLPRIDLPSAEDVIAFFNGVGEWFSRTFNADASLDIATRPAEPAAT
ncbi:MAG: hypothetical protein ACRD0K_15285 [Egibacteraceae bacterium]